MFFQFSAFFQVGGGPRRFNLIARFKLSAREEVLSYACGTNKAGINRKSMEEKEAAAEMVNGREEKRRFDLFYEA